MALKSDSQGFLIGESIGRDDLLDALAEIRDEISALRNDLAGLVEKPRATPSPKRQETSPQASPGASRPPERRSSEHSIIERVATPSRGRAGAPPTDRARDASGRFVATPSGTGGTGAGRPATPARRGGDTATGQRRSNTSGSAPTTRVPARGSAPATRDASGRFTAGEHAGGGSSVLKQHDRDGGGSMIADALSGVGERLRSGLNEINEEAKGTDPTVQAANEVAQPLARGFKLIFGGGQRSQNRWFRRFWQHLRKDKRDDDLHNKRQLKTLENIEDKPVGGDQGSGLWRMLLLMAGPLAGVLALMGSLLTAVVGLPLLLSGAILKGMGALLGLLGLNKIGRALIGAGGRMTGGARRGSRPPARRGDQAQRRGPPPRRGDQAQRGGRPPITGDADGPPPRRGSRLGRFARKLGRRIPGIGALLTLGFMASDVGASEGSDASREEKDRMTGRAVGGGVGALGGMAAGGMAGAAIGSVVPVVGTVIGGLVGSIAGAYFGGSAGEEIGEHVGGWVNELRGSDLVATIGEKFQWASDFTGALIGGIGDRLEPGWNALTAKMSATWDGLTSTLSETWDSLTATWDSLTAPLKARIESLKDTVGGAASAANDWIAERTGVNLGENLRTSADWVSDKASDAIDAAKDTASAAADKAGDIAGDAAEKAKDIASDVAESVEIAAKDALKATEEAATGAWEMLRRWGEEAMGVVGEAASEADAKAAVRAGAAGVVGEYSATAGGADAEMIAKFMERGWSKAQATGIVANLKHESNYDPQAVGDGGQAYGIAQWHPDRQAGFKSAFGKDIKGSSLDEQIAFVDHELRKGTDVGARRAGRMLEKTASAEEAARIVSEHYERPAKKEEEKRVRARTAAAMSSSAKIARTGGGVGDKTGNMSKYGYGGWGDLKEKRGFIVHHTGGRGDVEDIQRVFGERKVGTQYVIDREGVVHRTLPEGAKGQHIRGDSAHMTQLGRQLGLNNSNTEGVEIIAKDDSDVTPVQRDAAQQLARALGYRSDQVFGHGEINTHKRKKEGMTAVSAIRASGDQSIIAQTQDAERQADRNEISATPTVAATTTPWGFEYKGASRSDGTPGTGVDTAWGFDYKGAKPTGATPAPQGTDTAWGFDYKGAKPAGTGTPIDRLMASLRSPSMPAVTGGAPSLSSIAIPSAAQTVAAPQEISIPLGSGRGGGQDGLDSLMGAFGDVTRDLSDRRLAHIVTGSYSHAGAV